MCWISKPCADVVPVAHPDAAPLSVAIWRVLASANGSDSGTVKKLPLMDTFHADALERIAALHRLEEPMEVAGAVVFLLSPAASLMTGDTLMIDGGWTSR